MLPARAEIGRESRPLLALAWPVVAGELAWMGMGVVDTMMLGRLSPEALGAASVGRILMITIAVAGLGLLLGLDTLVAQAYGAGRREDCRDILIQGLWLALLLGPPLVLLNRGAIALLPWFRIDERVLPQAAGYMFAAGWSLAPFLLYSAFRRYLQAVTRVRAVMIALLAANLVNVLLNWVLIFGKFGMPALGAAGSGWATTGAMSFMALALMAVTELELHEQGRTLFAAWSFDRERIRELLRLGLPACGHLVTEVGVFALATTLAGRFAPVSLAAHQVALTAASVTYMVPLGLSSAAAVRVGHAIGRGAPRQAAVAGWTAILLGGAFMLAATVVFLAFPAHVARLFTDETAVIGASIALFYVAAAFQFADGVTITAIGALRGTGDTRTPAAATFVGFWLIALPLSAWLGFRRGLEVLGIWIGLCVGLFLVAAFIVGRWSKTAAAPHANLARCDRSSS